MKSQFINSILSFQSSVTYLSRALYCTLGHVLIGGGTGFIGNNLREILLKENYKVTVISRVQTGEEHIITWKELVENGIPQGVTDVVNLTSEPIMVPFKHFGYEYKKRIWLSRVGSTMLLTDIINCTTCKPDTLISVTSTDIYPSEGIYTEDFHPTKEMINCKFFTQLESDVENATKCVPSGVRHISIRTGFVSDIGTVLGYDGGFIKWSYYPTYMGLGANIGNGCQFQPWIHISDLLYLILFSIENKQIIGVLNGVSPEIISNGELTKMYAQVLKTSVKFNIPKTVLRAIYGKERSTLLLEGKQVIPLNTLRYGFTFEYQEIKKALEQLLNC